MIIQALSGGMSLTGEPDGSPVRAGIPLADLAGGMFATIGILSAVEERNRTGRGKVIDISLLDAQISMLAFQAAYHFFSGVVPGRQGCGHESIPTYGTFTARDGRDIVLAAVTEEMWKSLCRALESPGLLEDPRFATTKERLQHKEALWSILGEIFKTRDTEEWTAALKEAQVPVGEVKTVDRALRDPQVLHRGMVVTLENPDGPDVKAAGNPIRFNEGNRTSHRFPPPLGQDSVEILKSVLGKSEAEIKKLIDSEVVFTRKKDC
jgi:crotonobetainyl-CoA:carnitine CoA-transferase CaiB-like acyl-CoA transferase